MSAKLFIALLPVSLLLFACSNSNSTPEPDLTSNLVGTYTLSQLTRQADGSVITGTGSATVTAVDKSTTKIRQVLAIKISSASFSNVDFQYTYKVAPNGSSYDIQQEYDINKTITVGNATGSTLTTLDLVLPGATPQVPMQAVYKK